LVQGGFSSKNLEHGDVENVYSVPGATKKGVRRLRKKA
jgi:hypothetical protein